MKRSPERQFGPRQRGMTTLVIAIVLLIILSIVAMFATSVGLFEQRTATNENRAKLTQTAAESAVPATRMYKRRQCSPRAMTVSPSGYSRMSR